MITFKFEERCDYVLTILHKKWLKYVIRREGLEPGDLYFLFTGDEALLKYNIAYLHHDTLTDIITFDERIEDIVSGSILISLDRVRENASGGHLSFETELLRVIVHGVLHLCGYRDETPQEILLMRAKEDAAIGYFERLEI